MVFKHCMRRVDNRIEYNTLAQQNKEAAEVIAVGEERERERSKVSKLRVNGPKPKRDIVDHMLCWHGNGRELLLESSPHHQPLLPDASLAFMYGQNLEHQDDPDVHYTTTNTDLDLMDFSDTTIGMGQRANSTFQYLDYGPTLNGSGIGPAAGTISTLGHASPRSQQQQQQQQQQSYQSNNDVTSLQQNAILMPVYTAPTPTNGSSTLTEFTKRRNWSQRVIEELKDFLHILTPDGRITYVSPSVEFLLGYKPDKLVGHFIHDYIHTDDHAIYVREFNESIASGNSLRLFYRFRKADGSFAIFETVGHAHLTSEQSNFVPQGAAGFCRGFFMMARPYPTKNANLLDSFLEHKIENERLTRKIADLKREEREEDEAQQRHWATENPISNADVTTESEKATTISLDRSLMPPPAKPPISNILLTKENLLDVTASFKQDSINDKMARYEGATHIETIEMLTGLRYRDGERSKGISTGDASPTLIRGDAGIAISADKDGKAGDKKKKLKVADEYVCTDCGTLDSPEWRKGPSGPKTLCNACGLRWAKKEKKRSNPSTAGPSSLIHNTSTGSNS